MIPSRKSDDGDLGPVVPPKKKRQKKLPVGSMIFDIETCPQDEERLLALAPNFEPDSRLKDPEKIAVSIENQKRKYIERAALNWQTANVVLIGVSDGKEYTPIIGDEGFVLTTFFGILRSALANRVNFGGHNVKWFDFPMLINRARVLRVSVPQELMHFRNGRPQWNEFIFDTLEIFTLGDRQRIDGHGVDDICRTFGFPGKTADGAQFPSMWKSDQSAAIAYNENDCRCEVEIAKVCGFKFNE